MRFTDYKKTFDVVNRHIFGDILEEIWYAMLLNRIMKSLYDSYYNKCWKR